MKLSTLFRKPEGAAVTPIAVIMVVTVDSRSVTVNLCNFRPRRKP